MFRMIVQTIIFYRTGIKYKLSKNFIGLMKSIITFYQNFIRVLIGHLWIVTSNNTSKISTIHFIEKFIYFYKHFSTSNLIIIKIHHYIELTQ